MVFIIDLCLYIVIYICEYDGIRQFMIRAYHLGMCNGDYVFVYAWLFAPINDEWRRGDADDVIAKEAYKYVIHVSAKAGVSKIRKPLQPLWSKLNKCSRLKKYYVLHFFWSDVYNTHLTILKKIRLERKAIRKERTEFTGIHTMCW